MPAENSIELLNQFVAELDEPLVRWKWHTTPSGEMLVAGNGCRELPGQRRRLIGTGLHTCGALNGHSPKNGLYLGANGLYLGRLRVTDMISLNSRHYWLLAAALCTTLCTTGCGKQEHTEAVQLAKALKGKKTNF